ncbi:unnamed protein product, partial [Vitis vinifera]
MVLVGCPRCLMYVMLSEDDPKCPKCKSTNMGNIGRVAALMFLLPLGFFSFPPSSVNVNGANCNCPNFLIKLLGSFCFSFSISVARSCPSHFTSCHIGPYNQWSNC